MLYRLDRCLGFLLVLVAFTSSACIVGRDPPAGDASRWSSVDASVPADFTWPDLAVTYDATPTFDAAATCKPVEIEAEDRAFFDSRGLGPRGETRALASDLEVGHSPEGDHGRSGEPK